MKCEHDWQLVEVNLTGKGADQLHECSRCGDQAYLPAQAALGDTRPPL